MVQEITMFKCELTGEIFDSEENAIIREHRAKDFRDTFVFHKDTKLSGEDFIQYDKEYYNKIVNGIVKLMKQWEPILYEVLSKRGGKKNIRGIIGRYFCDGTNTQDFYTWWGTIARFCPKCYKIYNQPYHATHCNCQGEWRKSE